MEIENHRLFKFDADIHIPGVEKHSACLAGTAQNFQQKSI